MKRIFLCLFLLWAGVGKAQFYTRQLVYPDTLNGDTMTLTLQTGNHEFWPGIYTPTMGANGNLLGPTLMMQEADTVTIHVLNMLGESTTIHWHGLHVPADYDGGPHTVIPDASTWTVRFPVKNDAATFWYHPHLHMNTELHVTRGIAGFIYVRDNDEAALNLPRRYGVDDFPLVIQDRSFNPDGTIIVQSLSDSIMVNGVLWPTTTMPAQVVRLRLLNGSTARNYNLGFDDGTGFQIIGSDGSLLSTPHAADSVVITGGERFEILLDLTGRQGDTLYLRSKASTLGLDVPGGRSGMMGGPSWLNQVDYNFMQIIVGAPTANPVTTIPATLVAQTPLNPANASVTREKNMSGMGSHMMGNFFINGLPFDLGYINDTILLGATEVWELVNTSNVAHPFHIHDVQFYIFERNSAPPQPWEMGQKDVVLVRMGDTVKVVARFDDYHGETPFMFHCHNLRHEDDGMMGQFIVMDTMTTFIHSPETIGLKCWPNPAVNGWKISLDRQQEINWQLSDVQGRVFEAGREGELNFEISAETLPAGIYLLSVQSGQSKAIIRLVKN